MPRPSFIALEGIDGSGTTTQCRRLAAALEKKGHAVLETREPTDGAIGRLIRSALAARPDPTVGELTPAALALHRLDHLERAILPALRTGHVVVCDRYLLSSLAYQSLDCEPAWVEAINRDARRPDLTLLLSLPTSTAVARVDGRTAAGSSAPERFDAASVQARVAANYAELARRTPDVVVIDAAAAPDAVAAAILETCVAKGL
jgi:dTMP kinase